MARMETWLEQDLKKPLTVRMLTGNLFSMDNEGNLIGVTVLDGGEPAELAGDVSANVIRADGGTVAVTGTLEDNKAYIVLPQAAYAVPGLVTIIIKLTNDGVITTLAAMTAIVYRTSTATAIDPGTIIPSIQTLISDISTAVASIPADYSSLWTTLAPAFDNNKNYVEGQYVTYNGAVCRFIKSHSGSWSSGDAMAVDLGNELYGAKGATETADGVLRIKNTSEIKWTKEKDNGVRYDTGNDVSSGIYSVTNYINISAFSRITYKKIFSTSSSVNVGIAFYDKDKAYISGVVSAKNSETLHYEDNTVDVPSNAVYVRCTIIRDISYGTFAISGVSRLYNMINNKTLAQSIQVQDTDSWTQGGYKTSDGSTNASDNRIRRTLVSMNTEVGIRVVVPSGLKLLVFIYENDASNTYIGYQTWDTGEVVVYQNNKKFKIVAANMDDTTAILPSAGENIAVYAISSTDKTLTVAGKSADAKVTGDAINAINNTLNNEDSVREAEGYLKGNFERGDWRSDEYKQKLNRPYRVRSASQLTYPYDIELTAEPGYYFYFHTYEDDDFKLASVFGAHYATILANTEFDITISADPLDESVTADPEVYRKQVRVCKRRPESYAHNWPPLQRNQVLISGHRGWMGDITNYPENSTAAFEKAAQMGAWMIETDVQETSDGYFVCMHDSTVDRTTNGTGYVKNMTLEEIQELNLIGGDGTLKVPTLNDYLKICKVYNVVCHIEIKEVSDEKTSIPKIIDAVRSYGMVQQTSYNPHSLTAGDVIRQHLPFAQIHYLVETLNEKWNTFEKRANAIECMGNIRSGTDDFGNTAAAYRDQVVELHKRHIVTAKLSSGWSAQKAYLKTGFDYILSNDNLTIPSI